MSNNNGDAIISCEDSADLVAESVIDSRMDLGHSFIYRLTHPVRGKIIVFNSAHADCAVLHI